MLEQFARYLQRLGVGDGGQSCDSELLLAPRDGYRSTLAGAAVRAALPLKDRSGRQRDQRPGRALLRAQSLGAVLAVFLLADEIDPRHGPGERGTGNRTTAQAVGRTCSRTSVSSQPSDPFFIASCIDVDDA